MMEGCYEDLSHFLQQHYPYAEDVVQETLQRVMRNIQAGVQIKDGIEKYALSVARNVRREFDRQRRHLVRPVPKFCETEQDRPPIERGQLNRLIMETLSTNDRELFRSYFLSGANDVARHRKRLAVKLGVEPNTLCKRANRLLEKVVEASRQRNRDERN